ncbi:hypothetical protein [Jeotgalicoccus sp. WY2]|nr:hypothetical protein [Jeotgalicoccus sp. WY2]
MAAEEIMTLGKNGVMSLNPDFFMYQIYTNQIGLRYYSVPSREDFRTIMI